MHPMVLLGEVGQIQPRFDPFGNSVNLGARWVTVCTECTMDMEIILGTPDGTHR
jgi:class 3 adenylate cyclase